MSDISYSYFFSPSDSHIFINKKYFMTCMDVNFRKKESSVVVMLTDEIRELLNLNCFELEIFSINEKMNVGYINAFFQVEDYNLPITADGMSMELTLYGKATVKSILGHMSRSKELSDILLEKYKSYKK